ncbi:MAG: trypsin-like peptidase domain-containing protein [Planctomycetota bacterium]
MSRQNGLTRLALVLMLVALRGSFPAALVAQNDAVPDVVRQAEQNRIAAVAKASQPTIAVFEPSGQGGGSGVVISKDGFALTNFHVVQPCGDYMKCGMNDGRLYDAVIVSIDPTGDVALIKLLGRDDFPVAEIADSDLVKVGDWCFAIGNPLLLATDFRPTVSYGIVSGVHRYQYPAGTLLEYADCIQTDAAINPGNSGGPLFNAAGQLIGINGRGSFEKRGRVNVGVGYAISINQIQHFLGHLQSGRIVDHATLGATVATDDQGRVLVTNIIESSDAYRRGLRYGDEIVSFGGRAIGTTNAFKNVLGIFPKGWRVPLVYRRDGQRQEIYVRLSGVHTDTELQQLLTRRPPQPPRPRGKEDGPAPKPTEKPSEKPAEKPAAKPEEKPGEKPGEKPVPPKPVPGGPPGANRPAPKPIPAEAAKLIKKREGYVNYYFNELKRDQVWNAHLKQGDFTGTSATWKITGEVENEGEFEIVLGEKLVTAKLPSGTFQVDLSKDLDEQLSPPKSGGLLVALHLWQRMLRLGPGKFGEVYYLGRLPTAQRPVPSEVLVGTHQVMEARLLFESQTGQLGTLESYSDVQGDPCELIFADYQAIQGLSFPHRWECRFAGQTFGVLKVKSVDWMTAKEKP